MNLFICECTDGDYTFVREIVTGSLDAISNWLLATRNVITGEWQEATADGGWQWAAWCDAVTSDTGIPVTVRIIRKRVIDLS